MICCMSVWCACHFKLLGEKLNVFIKGKYGCNMLFCNFCVQLKTQAAGFSKHCIDSLPPPPQLVHREQIFAGTACRAWFPVSLLKNPVHERSGLRCCVSVCTLKHNLKHYNWVIQPKMNKQQNNTVIYLTKTNLKKKMQKQFVEKLGTILLPL